MDHKYFSVLFFFKPHRKTASVLAALRRTETENNEKNFIVFHFYRSVRGGGLNNLLISNDFIFYMKSMSDC
ncbi:hypothetical protein EI562_19480 [Enterobacter asburiae]|nr:hypothetical protein EI562_19480 [Enterobacter asburiae]